MAVIEKHQDGLQARPRNYLWGERGSNPHGVSTGGFKVQKF